MRRGVRRSGLTVIELLVSISILTAVLGAVLMTLYSGILVWERASGYDVKRMETMLALESLEKEVRSTFPFHAIGFMGRPTGVTFAGMLNEATAEGISRRFCEIEYTFDSSAHILRRQVKAYPFGSGGGEESVQVLSGINSVRITYAAARERGGGGGQATWQDSWNVDGKLPGAMRIEFEFSGSGGPEKITRSMSLPVRAPETRKAEGATDDAA